MTRPTALMPVAPSTLVSDCDARIEMNVITMTTG